MNFKSEKDIRALIIRCLTLFVLMPNSKQRQRPTTGHIKWVCVDWMEGLALAVEQSEYC